MRKTTGWIAVLAALAMVTIPALAGDGEVEAERFDLESLRDGEVRTLGEPGHQVIVERRGDTVIIRNDALRGELREIECKLGEDDCQVWSVAGSTLVHGAGGHGMQVFLHRTGCEGDDCDEQVTVRSHLVRTDVGGEREPHVFVIGSDEIGPNFRWTGDGLKTSNQTVLRCPEGDTTMRVEAEEADDTFLCPKHSTPLEKVATHHFRIRTERKPEE